MVDGRNNTMLDRSQSTIAHLCDRHFGIGADGLIILEESEKHNFTMRYYNADGLPGTMCGNGGRCTVAFAAECGMMKDICVFEAADGLHSAKINDRKEVELGMNDVEKIVKIEKDEKNKKLGEMIFLDTGSPHLIQFVDDVEAVDIDVIGKTLRYDERFPEGSNVNFVELSDGSITVRTYERGVEAETLSCGTGVTASAIATFMKNEDYGKKIKVHTRGGELSVSFEKENESITNIILRGPTCKVFAGEI